MIRAIPTSAWRAADGVVVARIEAPPVRRCILWIEGWDGADITSASAGAAGFTALPSSAFAATMATDGAILLRAPRVPRSGILMSLDAVRSTTLAAGWPRGLLPRRSTETRHAPPGTELVARLLDAGDIDTLVSLLGEALLVGAQREAVIDAARQLLLHRARHPLVTDPGLGTFAAALIALESS